MKPGSRGGEKTQMAFFLVHRKLHLKCLIQLKFQFPSAFRALLRLARSHSPVLAESSLSIAVVG